MGLGTTKPAAGAVLLAATVVINLAGSRHEFRGAGSALSFKIHVILLLRQIRELPAYGKNLLVRLAFMGCRSPRVCISHVVVVCR
jgi:hypothetical protein